MWSKNSDAPGDQTTRDDQTTQRSFIEQARRVQIIDAAIDVIVEEGFARASLSRIAARGGTSKGVVTYHFDGKEELVRAVVETIYTSAGDDLQNDVTTSASHPDRLAAYLRGNIAFLRSDRRRVVALAEIFTSFRRDDGRLVYDETTTGSVVEPLAEILRAGQAAGEFGAFDAWIMARTVRAAIDAIVPQLMVDAALDLTRYADELVATFTRATAVH